MRWLGCVALGLVAAAVGGLAFMQVGELVFAFTDAFAPGFFPGCYSGLIQYSSTEFDAPRKHAWADMVGGSALCGAACIGSVTLLIRGLRLGGAGAVLRAYLVVCLSGLAGACAGCGVGYLLGAAAPGYYRGVFPVGGEAWFNPLHVGVGLGVSQGLLVGLVAGALVAVAASWRRARVPAPAAHQRSPEPGAAPNAAV